MTGCAPGCWHQWPAPHAAPMPADMRRAEFVARRPDLVDVGTSGRVAALAAMAA